MILSSINKKDQLCIVLDEYEKNEDEKGDYLSFTAEVDSNGFRGWTLFWVSRRDMDVFLSRLREFECKLQGTASIKCGWGDQELFSLEFFTYDSIGHLGVRCEFATASARREEVIHRIQTEFEIEPTTVTGFIKDLQTMINEAAE